MIGGRNRFEPFPMGSVPFGGTVGPGPSVGRRTGGRGAKATGAAIGIGCGGEEGVGGGGADHTGPREVETVRGGRTTLERWWKR